MRESTDNLVGWVETALQPGETIEGVVLGQIGWNYEPDPEWVGKLMAWEQAKPIIDRPFYSGYGAPGCHAIYVWTNQRVLFISQYDGSTSLESVPRNPCDIKPEMPGGG